MNLKSYLEIALPDIFYPMYQLSAIQKREVAPEIWTKSVMYKWNLAVHADRNAIFLEQSGKFSARKLASLIRVEHLGTTMYLHRFLNRLDTEIGAQGVGKLPGEYAARVPVHHSEQVDKSFLHRDIRDIGSPDLIRSGDLQIAQQIGANRVARMRFAGAGLAKQRGDAHFLLQRADAAAPDFPPVPKQHLRKHPRACEGVFQMQLVDASHESQDVL